MKRTISVMVGKGSVNHNSRKFHAKNTDPERSNQNVEYCDQDIREVYHELFDEALERYNRKQTRNDRRIDNYYEKICSSKQEKAFHEIILQIGNRDDMNAQTEEGQLAAKVLDEYMESFQQRNPTLKVFSSHLHMDEATPHLHIDFVPYTTGSKRGLDTRVSLKQALASLGFKGGTRSETEWNQWVASEKQQLAVIMDRHGIEWEKKGTHEKHLSVLDFEKKERAKEVAELTAQKTALKEENSAFVEINQNLHEQLCGIDDEIRSMLKSREQAEEQVEKAKKQMSQYRKQMQDMAPLVENMEHFAEKYSGNLEETLPEAAFTESGRSYREKKAKPLVKKLVSVLRSVYRSYLDISRQCENFQGLYYRAASNVESLTTRLQETLKENKRLRNEVADYGRVKTIIGSRQVEEAVKLAKLQEADLADRKRAIRKYRERGTR